jgi:hypothetical protein
VSWHFVFARDRIQLVQDLLADPAPAYAAILDVDAKVRSYELPPALRTSLGDYAMAAPGDSISLIMARTGAHIAKETGVSHPSVSRPTTQYANCRAVHAPPRYHLDGDLEVPRGSAEQHVRSFRDGDFQRSKGDHRDNPLLRDQRKASR